MLITQVSVSTGSHAVPLDAQAHGEAAAVVWSSNLRPASPSLAIVHRFGHPNMEHSGVAEEYLTNAQELCIYSSLDTQDDFRGRDVHSCCL